MVSFITRSSSNSKVGLLLHRASPYIVRVGVFLSLFCSAVLPLRSQESAAVVQSLRVLPEQSGPVVEITSTRPIVPAIQKIDGPPRLVVDLPGPQRGRRKSSSPATLSTHVYAGRGSERCAFNSGRLRSFGPGWKPNRSWVLANRWRRHGDSQPDARWRGTRLPRHYRLRN